MHIVFFIIDNNVSAKSQFLTAMTFYESWPLYNSMYPCSQLGMSMNEVCWSRNDCSVSDRSWAVLFRSIPRLSVSFT